MNPGDQGATASKAPSRGGSAFVKRGLARAAPKRTQRQRLIDALIELSAKSGFHAVTVTDLCSYAGVSPVSFYQQFSDKEECFLAAYLACGEQIFGGVRTQTGDVDDVWQAARLALSELLAGIERDPDAGRLLFIEALGAGGAVDEARAGVLEQLQMGASEVLARTPGDVERIDVPLMAVIGALRHVISRQLWANAEDELPSLLEDGLTWLSCYAVAPTKAPWSTSPAALLAEMPHPVQESTWKPQTLPAGSHKLPTGVVARSHRTRLINAIAEVVMAKGFQSAKVTDIVGAARVAKPVFYEHFPQGKEQAFLEAQDYPTQFILDRCADAYFSADEWPERMWRMLETLLELILSNPAISHLRLVECYAAGPTAIRRAEDVTRSFTIFLHEGYRYRRQAASLPRLCSQAIAGAIFETVQRLAAAGEWDQIARHLPQLTYIAIAPFVGAEDAIGLVEDLKARERRGQRSRSRRPPASVPRSTVPTS